MVKTVKMRFCVKQTPQAPLLQKFIVSALLRESCCFGETPMVDVFDHMLNLLMC